MINLAALQQDAQQNEKFCLGKSCSEKKQNAQKIHWNRPGSNLTDVTNLSPGTRGVDNDDLSISLWRSNKPKSVNVVPLCDWELLEISLWSFHVPFQESVDNKKSFPYTFATSDTASYDE